MTVLLSAKHFVKLFEEMEINEDDRLIRFHVENLFTKQGNLK